MKNKIEKNRIVGKNISTKYLIYEYYIPYISALIIAISVFLLPILAILHIQGYINIF